MARVSQVFECIRMPTVYSALRPGEQKPFGENSGWVRQPGRVFKFPGGESLTDVRKRADQA